jgi:hypothetical protein
MPTDPRSAAGKCASLDVQAGKTFDGTYSAWQTGGVGAGSIDAASRSQFGNWPPTTIHNLTPASPAGPTDVSLLPRYTNTGSGDELPGPTITAVLPLKSGVRPSDGGNGMSTVTITPSWKNTGIGASAQPTMVNGCQYPNAWDATGVNVPTTTC